MKTIKLVIFLLFVTFFCSCVYNPPKKFVNEQQNEFDDMLVQIIQKSRSVRNEIAEQEFNDSIRLAMGQYMDSTKLFVNWKATIKDIKSTQSGSLTNLSFVLYYKPEEYREVEFYVDYLVSNDSLKTDKVYQTVKNLSNYSTVYFDGFIRTKNNGEAYYQIIAFEDLIYSYPDFKFFVVDVNTTSKGDTLPPHLHNAIDLGFEAIEPLKLNYRKEISDTESKKRLETITPRFNVAKDSLTTEELSYINRLMTALTYNFMFAK